MKKHALIVQDLLGISSATLCLIHCVVFPLLTVLPLGMAHNPWIDVFFFGVAAVLIFSIVKGTGPLYMKMIFLFSLILVFIGIVFEYVLHSETFLVPIGGLGIIIGHSLHFLYHQKK